MAKKIKTDALFLIYIGTLRGKMKKLIGDEQARFYPLNLTEAKKLWKAGVHPDHAWDGFIKDKSAEEIIKLHGLCKSCLSGGVN